MATLQDLQDYIDQQPNHFSRYIERCPGLYALIKDQPGTTNVEKAFNALNPGVRFKHLTCKVCARPLASFISFTDGYRIYCSNKCSNNDPTVSRTHGLHTEAAKQKRAKSLIEKYGTDSMITVNRTKALHTIRTRRAENYWNELVPVDTDETDIRDDIYAYIYFNPLKPISASTAAALAPYKIVPASVFEPFYVGAGVKRRSNFHLNEARVQAHSSHKTNTIRKIWESNLKPIIVRLPTKTRREAMDLEKELIRAIGTVANIEGIKRGPLANEMPGGEGGASSNPAVTAKLKQARVGKRWITDGVSQKFVPEIELAEWGAKGWRLGARPSAKRDAYFEQGSRLAGSVWVNKDGENKRVDDPEPLLKEGWKIGQLSTNPGQHKRAFIWITNGVDSVNHRASEPIPDGWRKGRLRKKYPGGYKKKA